MATRFKKLAPFGVVLAAAAIFVALAVSVSSRVGVTYDEVGHIGSAYGAWRYGDYRVNAENGILAARFTALPLTPLDLRFPPRDSAGWKNCNAREVGIGFIHELGNDAGQILTRARLGMALVGALLLALIAGWARRLFGPAAGWLALALALLSPTLLAHAGLATSDLLIAACLLAAVGAWWKLWHRVNLARVLLAGLTAGLALTAKMSGLLLLPVLVILFVARCLKAAPLPVQVGRRGCRVRARPALFAALLAAGALGAGVALVIVWAGYGFRFSAAPPGAADELTFRPSWHAVLGGTPAAPAPPNTAAPPGAASVSGAQLAAVPRLIAWARDQRLLPEAFLWGAAYTYRTSLKRESYLMGRVSSQGSALFFPVAFALKSTPAELLLFLAGAVALVTGGRLARHPARTRPAQLRTLYRGAPLWVLAIVYGVVALTTPLNIGHRHLLPIYPVVFVLAGAAALWLRTLRRALGVGLLIVVISAQAVDSWAARPFYLAYFTPFVGGQREGWRYLADSSFDWGQGLPDLARWLANQKQRGDTTRVFLSYFGSDSPRARGLGVTRFGDARDDWGDRHFPVRPTGGWYVISATYFHGLYLNLSPPWSAVHERHYAETQQAFDVRAPNAARLPPEQRAQLFELAKRLEVLRFGRLCHLLQARRPDAVIGASLLAFKVSDEDASLALAGPLDEVNARIARDAAHR